MNCSQIKLNLPRIQKMIRTQIKLNRPRFQKMLRPRFQKMLRTQIKLNLPRIQKMVRPRFRKMLKPQFRMKRTQTRKTRRPAYQGPGPISPATGKAFGPRSVIGTKLGFRPPPLSSYTIIETGGRTTFNLDATRDGHFVHGLLRLHTFDAFTTVTTRHSTIACMFIPCQRPRFTLFISHGKDVDIGQKINFYYELSTGLQCNVFSYDYSGYGQSTGTPSEANMYADAEAALNALRANYNLTNPEIIIYGHQIGTAASTYLAARNTGLAGLILISPFMSGIRIAYPSMPFSFWFDCFPSIDRISSVRCRTIIIESENEEYYRPIDGHGEKLFANLHPGLRVELLRFQSGDDGVEHTCLARLQQFVTQEAGEVPGY
uniref:Hydrolase_4 domain-containing protein n=1 Tax=Panagrellus redivivus TaxID=6233 RepID=A0A7E4VYB2_PANRE